METESCPDEGYSESPRLGRVYFDFDASVSISIDISISTISTISTTIIIINGRSRSRTIARTPAQRNFSPGLCQVDFDLHTLAGQLLHNGTPEQTATNNV